MEKAFNRFNNAVVLNVVEPVERFFPQFHRRIMRHIYKKHEIQTFRYKQISQHRHLKTQTPISGDSFSCLPEQKYRDGPNLPTNFLYCLRKSCCLLGHHHRAFARRESETHLCRGGRRRLGVRWAQGAGGRHVGARWADWRPRVDGREKCLAASGGRTRKVTLQGR